MPFPLLIFFLFVFYFFILFFVLNNLLMIRKRNISSYQWYYPSHSVYFYTTLIQLTSTSQPVWDVISILHKTPMLKQNIMLIFFFFSPFVFFFFLGQFPRLMFSPYIASVNYFYLMATPASFITYCHLWTAIMWGVCHLHQGHS